jgi:hypothetical protein
VIEELIALAKDMREADARRENLGLSEDELAFYDALETNDSAVKVLGDETLRAIARELVETVRKNVTIDWTLRENVRAHLRVLVKRILRKHGYRPTSRRRRRGRCWNRRRSCLLNGRRREVERSLNGGGPRRRAEGRSGEGGARTCRAGPTKSSNERSRPAR